MREIGGLEAFPTPGPDPHVAEHIPQSPFERKSTQRAAWPLPHPQIWPAGQTHCPAWQTRPVGLQYP